MTGGGLTFVLYFGMTDRIRTRVKELDDAYHSAVNELKEQLTSQYETLVQPGERVIIKYDPHHNLYWPDGPPDLTDTTGVIRSTVRVTPDYSGGYFLFVDVEDRVGVREYDLMFLELIDEM